MGVQTHTHFNAKKQQAHLNQIFPRYSHFMGVAHLRVIFYVFQFLCCFLESIFLHNYIVSLFMPNKYVLFCY